MLKVRFQILSLFLFIACFWGTVRAEVNQSPDLKFLLDESPIMETFAPKRKKSESLAIPYEMNPSIQYWIDQFTGPLRYKFVQFLERGAFHKSNIEKILVTKGLPAELYYLAMIESGFITTATSRTKARGIWQFMKHTATLYGLKINRRMDQRLDPTHSTYAACRYLSKLHREFGSWYLAMAAYNAGEGRVRRAIREGGSRDFWTLVEKGALPQETSQYVPEFQAAMQIAMNPDYYGFEVHNSRTSLVRFQ
jgi:membrane-bound lytic murein transglycosylase D